MFTFKDEALTGEFTAEKAKEITYNDGIPNAVNSILEQVLAAARKGQQRVTIYRGDNPGIVLPLNQTTVNQLEEKGFVVKEDVGHSGMNLTIIW